MHSRSTSVVLATLLAVVSSTPVQAQECGYPDCALRVQYGVFGGVSLVRAETGEKVRGVGFPVLNIEDAFAGSNAAQLLAATYQKRTNLGTALILAGGIAFGIWLFAGDHYTDDWYDNPWMWTGFTLSFSGGLIATSGRDYLSRAVWEYNRSLPR